MAFESLSQRLGSIFDKLRKRGKLSESDVKEAMREVRLALLEADVNFKVARDFVKNVSEKAIGQEITKSLTPGQQVIAIVRDELVALMGKEQSRLTTSGRVPAIYMLAGLQGNGKTTAAAKLAVHLRKQGKKPMLAACDIYRPAAIEQLHVLGRQANIPVFDMGTENPVTIAENALKEAKRLGCDVLLLDTAGRLHIDDALMGELEAIKAAVPIDEILLVIDAMTGQDAVNVAQAFNERLEIGGVIVTKLDSDTRGGAALSVRAITGKPIKFASVGEKLSDLEPFHPARMASRILGMGDIETLIDKAMEAVDQEKAEEQAKRLLNNSFTLADYLDQLEQINKMGGIQDVLKMMPGAGRLGQIDIDDKQIARVKALIQSMTVKERNNPDLLNASRKKRIAAGSGQTVQDVNRLLKQFDSMRQMMKQFTGKNGKRRMRMPFGMGMGMR